MPDTHGETSGTMQASFSGWNPKSKRRQGVFSSQGRGQILYRMPGKLYGVEPEGTPAGP